MLTNERYLEILSILKQKSSVTTVQLTKLLNVSESTVKRDLAYLEQLGKLQRVHGGAISISAHRTLRVDNESPVIEKMKINQLAKKEICKEALSLIKDKDVLFIDSGTTPLYLAEMLMNRDVVIVSNNLLLTSMKSTLATIYFLGGKFEDKSKIIYGDFAVSMLSNFRFDHCFMGANGISKENNEAMVTVTEVALLKQKALNQSAHRVLLVDKSKEAVQAPYPYAKLSDFDCIISK